MTADVPLPGLAFRTPAPSLSARLSARGPVLPAAVLPNRPVEELLAAARLGLAQSAGTLAGPQDGRRVAARYAAAHLAALRGASAVLAARARPGPGRGRPTSVWTLLRTVAPELGEWADFFAAGTGKRAAAEAGLTQAVTAREADDLLRDAQTFLALVERALPRSR